MIDYIKGIIVKKETDHIILESNDIGYLVFCSSNVLDRVSVKQNILILIYYQQTDETVNLFGFLDSLERDLFLLLKAIGGVGVKTAIKILSASNYDQLISAIKLDKAEILSGIKGIGKKLAEKIIFSLKDKLGKLPVENLKQFSDTDLDVIEALKSFGYKDREILKSMQKFTNLDLDFEKKFKSVLQDLSKKTSG